MAILKPTLIQEAGIEGDLYIPQGPCLNLPTVVICHGFTGRKDDNILRFIARRLCEEGCLVFSMNFSDRLLSTLSVTGEKQELEEVLGFIARQEQCDVERIAVLGHCLGGLIAARQAAFGKLGFIKTLLLLTPTYDLRGTSDLLVGERMLKWHTIGCIDFRHRRERKELPLSFHFYQATQDLLHLDETLRLAKQPTLVILDKEDPINPYDKARHSLDRHKGPRNLVPMTCQNHGHFTREERTVCVRAILAFLQQHL